MSNIDVQAESRGNIMLRLHRIERQIQELRAERGLQASTIGRGGLRVKGTGGITVQDGGGLAVLGGGDITVQDGGGVRVSGGGDINVDGGQLAAIDSAGTVFAVDTDPASIVMRKELITDLVEEIVEELLTSAAGEELAAFVLGNRVHSATVSASQSTSSTGFTDLSTTGPTLSGVDISDARKAVVLISSDLVSASTPQMGFSVSGASSVSASETRALIFGIGGPFGVTLTRVVTLTSSLLNEGTHTFTAKYRDLNGNSSTFANRNLAVIAY